ncbi:MULTISPECIES: hypothetical protein [unclassified Shewanella]
MLFSIVLATIVLLPFLLLLGLLSFITIKLLSNKQLNRHPFTQSRYQASQTPPSDIYRGNADIQREQAAPYADMFNPSGAKNPRHTGRTFEHQGD